MRYACRERERIPLFDFSLFRNNRGFSVGNLTVLIVAMGEFGVLFFLSIYLQEVRDLSAINTGITMLPLAITAFFLAPLAGVASNNRSKVDCYSRNVSRSSWAIQPVASHYHFKSNLVPLSSTRSLRSRVGLAIGQLTNTVLATVPWQKAGIGSGINNTLRQVGSAFGIAVMGAVLVSVLVSVGKADLAASTVIPDSVKVALQNALSSGLSGRA